MTENMLASARRLWEEAASEFDPSRATAVEAEIDPSAIKTMGESLKKVSKWLDHTITKFGACAAVADAKDMQGLKPVAAEVIKALIAAIGTMVSLRRGAGASLCTELRNAGQELASTLEQLGASVGQPTMALCAGRALDRAQCFERLSTHNRFAIERRLQAILDQLRDGHRDLQDALGKGEVGDDDDDEVFIDEDLGFDDSLEPDERRVAEAANTTVTLVEELLDKAIKASIPGQMQECMDLMLVGSLEIVVAHGVAAADAIDGLIVHVVGGLDQKEFAQSLDQVRMAVTAMRGSGLDVQNLDDSLNGLYAELLSVEDE